jgi:hypothetical protein
VPVEIIISFAGTSHAIEAERLLTEAGFTVRVMPAPAAIGAGCGFCLRASSGHAAEICCWMREQGVPHSRIYEKEEGEGADVYFPLDRGADYS